MKTYPIIDKQIRFGAKIYAFDKLDGSNIRTEWNPKKKFYKFGTRKRLLHHTEDLLGESIYLIKEKYERDLSDIFKKTRSQKIVCFFEFFGENSFAGNHENESHDVVLFDVSFHKKGLLPASEFLKMMKNVHIADLLYYGNCNVPFVDSVKSRTLEGMTFEGVVCKGQIERPGLPLMFKIKSNEWVNRLRHYCRSDEKLFGELL